MCGFFSPNLVQKIFYSIIICNIMLPLSPRLRCPHAEHKEDRILRNTDSFGDSICYLNLLVPFNTSREVDFLNISLRTSGQWDVWIWAHLWIVEINLSFLYHAPFLNYFICIESVYIYIEYIYRERVYIYLTYIVFIIKAFSWSTFYLKSVHIELFFQHINLK